jgi:hypothetical protein
VFQVITAELPSFQVPVIPSPRVAFAAPRRILACLMLNSITQSGGRAR